jgi:hypothetical protein
MSFAPDIGLSGQVRAAMPACSAILCAGRSRIMGSGPPAFPMPTESFGIRWMISVTPQT